jgi:hypothetical protein
LSGDRDRAVRHGRLQEDESLSEECGSIGESRRIETGYCCSYCLFDILDPTTNNLRE